MRPRPKLPSVNTKHRPNYGNSPYPKPIFSFALSPTNLFKLHKKTRSLYPHMFRNNDKMDGYLGRLGSKDQVKHHTFPRFAPKKLYINTVDSLLPPRRSTRLKKIKSLPKLKNKKIKNRNPFHLHDPSCETIFLYSHESHGKRPVLKYKSPPSCVSP